ncbi:hypothetical protein [Microcoleus sp. S13_C5]|uniref:hypothetical protein n=1 Tax=Microcoleus sp. S13_C5 TaxID=3055411 RepID=UPI002FCF4724
MKTVVFVVGQAQKPISDIGAVQVREAKLSPLGESRRPISFKFCASVADSKALYILPRKINLQPLNCDLASMAISLWAAEMPAHAARQFMCLEAISPILSSLLLAVPPISLNAGDRTNN